MKLWHRKNRLQRLLEKAEKALDVPDALSHAGTASGNRLKVPLPGGKAVKASVNQDTALKAGVIATSLVGLTAGSAGISALRRRTQGAGDDS